LNSSEDLRQIENEWERIWFVDQPSHLTPERVHGGIDPAEPPAASATPADVSKVTNLFVEGLAEPPFGGFPGAARGRRAYPVADLVIPVDNYLKSPAIESASRLYARPSFSNDARLFSDLVAYAPGMNTSRADIEAVLDAEAVPELRAAPGRIDPAARKLIERARSAGWQGLTVPHAFTLLFDGRGWYAYERALPLGLREQVVCDGRTLLHLYPELGIGARRTVSRFHRAELLRAIPWLVPPAEDLARGADVKYIDEHTIAIVPPGLKSTPSEPGRLSP